MKRKEERREREGGRKGGRKKVKGNKWKIMIMAQHAPNNMAPKHTGQQLELQEEIDKTCG